MAGIKGMRNSSSTKFKPGQSGNPAGRRPDPPEIKQLKKELRESKELDRLELTETFSELYRKTLPEIEGILRDKSLPVKLIGMARSLRMWMRFGDFRYVQPYFAYLYGLPKAPTELTGRDGKPLVLANSIDLSKIPLEVLVKLIEEKK